MTLQTRYGILKPEPQNGIPVILGYYRMMGMDWAHVYIPLQEMKGSK